MSQTAYTMPEAKHRSTKKREKPVTSIRTSEFAQEVKSLQSATQPAKTKIHLVAEKAEAKPVEKPAIKLTSFWPVAVGLFLAGFAPEWHAIAAQAGIWVMRFTFPFSMLASHREVGLDPEMVQFAIFAQLPIDGLLMTVAMARGNGLKNAIAQVTSVHAVCAFVLWLLTYLGK